MYCREKKILVVNVISNFGLSQMKKNSLPDYAHINKVSENLINQCQLMSYNMMIGYDFYRFTMEHFTLRQSIILTTSFFCSRQ
jgi:hypothetical protein